jgi:putative NADH-flavin reductase
LHVLVIGATGGIGQETLKSALSDGLKVRAFSRSSDQIQISNPKLEIYSGNALHSEEITEALDGIDVVIQALGVKINELFKPINIFSESTKILISAMEHKGIKRLITVTGFGAGDSRKAISCLQQLPFQFLLGRAYADKDIQERIIKESQLEWTIIRPGVLTNGKFSGKYKVLTEPFEWRNGIISRADVAHFIVSQLGKKEYVRLSPVLINR